jgi:hypothetical protein
MQPPAAVMAPPAFAPAAEPAPVPTAAITAPAAPPQAQLEQCALLPNTNAKGTVIKLQQDVNSVADCCTLCQQTQGCNVFVYCPQNGGW